MSADYCVGIDLGTTNTLCAVWVRGEPGPRVLRVTQPTGDFTAEHFSREDDLLPSAVAVLPEGVFVGAAAKNFARTGADQTITSIKRHMGTHWNRRIEDTDWTPEMVAGCILKAVRRELVPPLGQFDGEPRRVVITVPASFGTEQRRATLRAARLAGFDPETTLLFDEPTAALLHHLQGQAGGIDKLPDGHRMMMIDIGGGTLDVSLMQLVRNGDTVVADIQGRSRFNELAGDDFDLNLAGYLLARYEEQRGPVRQGHTDRDQRQLFHEMLIKAEKAKQELSTRGQGVPQAQRPNVRTPVVLEMTPDRKPWRYELSLQDLADALVEFFPLPTDRHGRESEYTFYRPLQQCLTSVEQIVHRAIEPEEVNAVFLTGGSSLLPMVPAMVRRFMTQPPVRLAAPLQAVALGAGWYAGMVEGYAGRSLELRERLYDGLMLQTGGGQFRQLLQPWEEVPQVGSRRYPLGTVLELSKPERRIEVGLFLGSRPDDANMVPLAQRRLDFGTVLPKRQPVELAVSISRNRDIQFEFTTQFLGRQCKGQVEVSTFRGWEDEQGPARELPEVNQPIRGPRP